jgi:hypothetical protein
MTADEQAPLHHEIILYATPDGAVRVEVVFENETFWLSQKKMAELFGVESHTITYHLKEIYKSGELKDLATTRRIRVVQPEGGRGVARGILLYNLDAIIAVGYRVNSREATQFRIWATQVLREYLIKGFVLDDERLKQGKRLGKDYFDELLERIRSIRASERRFYLKITDIYEQCSIDYNRNAEITQTFFKTVQNKLHWAITGKTAAELIAERAQAGQPNMGLKTWKNAPHGRIQKADITVAKNYLEESEIKALERIVSMYLDYAENQAARQITVQTVCRTSADGNGAVRSVQGARNIKFLRGAIVAHDRKSHRLVRRCERAQIHTGKTEITAVGNCDGLCCAGT